MPFIGLVRAATRLRRVKIPPTDRILIDPLIEFKGHMTAGIGRPGHGYRSNAGCLFTENSRMSRGMLESVHGDLRGYDV